MQLGAVTISVAVRLLPGIELAFAGQVVCRPAGLLRWKIETVRYEMAILRQVNKEKLAAHHDALEFPDGEVILLNGLLEGQEAVVLQLPARPATASEAEAQKGVVHVG